MLYEAGRTRSEAIREQEQLNDLEVLRGLGLAVFTLFVTPRHNKLHKTAADSLATKGQPL